MSVMDLTKVGVCGHCHQRRFLFTHSQHVTSVTAHVECECCPGHQFEETVTRDLCSYCYQQVIAFKDADDDYL